MRKNEIISPKPTFLNLAADKRQRVLNAALAEFAEKGYSKASVNTIVKATGIAKGSLYQYFTNKQQLFLFLFEDFLLQVKRAVREAAASRPAADFFSQIEAVFQAGARFVEEFPAYFQIYLRVLFEKEVPFREQLLERVRLFSADYFGPLCDDCKKNGQLRGDIPTDTIIFMVDALLDRYLQDYAVNRLEPKEAMQDEEKNIAVDALLSALRQGIATIQ